MHENPFVAQARSIRGYDSQDLWRKANYMEVFLLHFLGELPSQQQRRAVEMLFIGLMNLGPRELENRSAMIAGISKTRPEHLLSIGLLAGESDANEVKLAYEFIRNHCVNPPPECLATSLAKKNKASQLAPGFGHQYGAIDPLLQKLALDILNIIPESPSYKWCIEFVELLQEHQQGWLASGLTAAVCISVGISAQNSVGVYQLAKSVGIVAYGMEQVRLPMSKAPFLSDEFYEQTAES